MFLHMEDENVALVEEGVEEEMALEEARNLHTVSNDWAHVFFTSSLCQ